MFRFPIDWQPRDPEYACIDKPYELKALINLINQIQLELADGNLVSSCWRKAKREWTNRHGFWTPMH